MPIVGLNSQMSQINRWIKKKNVNMNFQLMLIINLFLLLLFPPPWYSIRSSIHHQIRQTHFSHVLAMCSIQQPILSRLTKADTYTDKNVILMPLSFFDRGGTNGAPNSATGIARSFWFKWQICYVWYPSKTLTSMKPLKPTLFVSQSNISFHI